MRVLYLFLSGLLLLSSASSFSEERFQTQKEWREVYLDFYFKEARSIIFTGNRDLEIYTTAYLHPEPKGAIVLSGGLGEASIKYVEEMHYFYQLGYSVFSIDHRDQGFSGRADIGDPHYGYVESFQDYVDDFTNWMENHVRTRLDPKKPLYLLAHSTGAAIASYYVMDHPDVFDRAAFSSPLFGMTKYFKGKAIHENLVLATALLFKDRSLALEEEDYHSSFATEEAFQKNNFTHSRERFFRWRNLMEDYPILRWGGVTNKWVIEAVRATKTLRERASEFKVPLLVMQAGEDTEVSKEAQKKFCQTAPDCKLKVLAGGFHELLMEKDEVRNQVLKLIKNHLDL